MFALRTLPLAGIFLALAACQGEQATDTSAAPASDAVVATPAIAVADQAPKGSLGTAVLPTAYDLHIQIVPDEPGFSGDVSIKLNLRAATDRIHLHGKGLDVGDITLETVNQSLTGTWDQVDAEAGIATIRLSDTAQPGSATLAMRYSGTFNGSLEGLYKVEEAGKAYAYTQFEAISARLAFPGFDDPQFKTPFSIAVTGDPKHVIITSTPLVEQTPAGNGLARSQFATTKPLPTYLLAFAVGPQDLVNAPDLPPTTIRDRAIPFEAAAAAGKGQQLAYAIEHTQPILEALEAYFAVPYPYKKLGIIAAPDFAAGAMENVGAILYREQLLLLDETSSFQQRRFYGLVHAHELAHQWFGNLVTPKWWDDIWLNEAFATWMGNKAADAWQPEFQFARRTQSGALRVMAIDSLASARQIRQPVLSNNDIANAFDGITYRKGGGVLSMFENYLGEDKFRDGVRLHMQRFADDVATTDDFMRSLADGSGKPEVVPAFRSFIDQPGVPLVEATLRCDDGKAAVTLKQSRFRPLGSSIKPGQQWQIPACVRVIKAGAASKQCTLIDAIEQSMPLDSCPDAIVPNADGAGYYRWTLDSEGWAATLANLDTLNVREQLSLADSVTAAFEAGEISAATLADAYAALSTQPAWDVVTAPLGDLEKLIGNVADEGAADAIRQWMRNTYAPRLAAIGLVGDSDADAQDAKSTALLREALVEHLVIDAAHAELTKTLAQQARDYLGNGKRLSPDAINPDLVATALRAGVLEYGKDFANKLVVALNNSTDAVLRQRVLQALSSAKDDAISAIPLELALTDKVRDNEVRTLLRNQFANPAARAQAWTWLQANLDGVIERVPVWNQGDIVALPHDFCSAKRKQELQDFFGPKVDELQGGPRDFALAVEQIELCVALKAKVGDTLEAAFSG
ncbi:M1 family metallopeptidase [bacterium]|nr:M1 family metallopeptidase [bacterium]